MDDLKEVLDELKKLNSRVEELVKFARHNQEWLEINTQDQRVAISLLKDFIIMIKDERREQTKKLLEEIQTYGKSVKAADQNQQR